MGAELTNLDGFGNEQTEESQHQQPPEQPAEESGEWEFTDVSLEDINRDDLTPQMQAVYDGLLEKAANMDADYTQKSQQNAALRRDAETWRMVSQHPELSRVMNEALYNIDRGLPARGEQQQQSPQQEPPDPNQDPVGFIREVVRTEIKGVLDEVLPPLQQGMQQVGAFVQNNQAKLEFDNLATQYPAAKGIGMEELNRVRSQYRDSYGRPVSMATALAIYAQDNPAILQRSQQQPVRIQPKSPPVEPPRQQRGSTTPTPLPEGIRKLQADVAAQQKAGTIADLGAAVRRAVEKFRS